jgi:hypothetical protein
MVPSILTSHGLDERIAALGRRREGPGSRTGTTLMEVTRDLETIASQERELILAHFDPEIARQLGLQQLMKPLKQIGLPPL